MEKRKWFEKNIKEEGIRNYLLVFIENIENRLGWYKVHRKRKRFFSNILITIAILTFTLSLFLIIIFGPEHEVYFLSLTKLNMYSLGYICLLIASTMLLVDRLFGHSSGWIRYMITELELEKAIGEFHGKWISCISNMNLDNLSSQDKTSLMDMLINFDKTIRDVIIDETGEWKENFTTQLDNFRKEVNNKLKTAKDDLDNYQKKLKENSKEGNLNLELKNPKEGSIRIVISSKEIEKLLIKNLEVTQTSVNFMDLKIGRYSLSCTHQINNKDILKKEIVFEIKGSDTIKKSIDLTK